MKPPSANDRPGRSANVKWSRVAQSAGCGAPLPIAGEERLSAVLSVRSRLTKGYDASVVTLGPGN